MTGLQLLVGAVILTVVLAALFLYEWKKDRL
jgi:hypothetical protein